MIIQVNISVALLIDCLRGNDCTQSKQFSFKCTITACVRAYTCVCVVYARGSACMGTSEFACVYKVVNTLIRQHLCKVLDVSSYYAH